jgi:hypothetical protein
MRISEICAKKKPHTNAFKVVSETQNIKASSNQSVNNSLKGNQTDLKDTNFEYEDNEWDIGKLGEIKSNYQIDSSVFLSLSLSFCFSHRNW